MDGLWEGECVKFFQKWEPWSLPEREDEMGYLEFENTDSGVHGQPRVNS